jgi:hypothetical protein
MKATIENGELVIRLPLNKTPVPSLSGKTLVIATSHSNQKTDAVVNGKPVVIGVNAYIARPTRWFAKSDVGIPLSNYTSPRSARLPSSGGRAFFFSAPLAKEAV